MNDIDKLRAKHATELAQAKRENAIEEALPVPPKRMFAHNEYCAVTYEHDGCEFGKALTMEQARKLLAKFDGDLAPVTCEHRSDGCLSIAPADLMTERDRGGKLVAMSQIRVTLNGGKGFGPDYKLTWYSRVGDDWIKAEAALKRFAPLRGDGATYDRQGHVRRPAKWFVDTLPGSKVITWGTGGGEGYRFTWHWETLESFLAWAETVDDGGA